MYGITKSHVCLSNFDMKTLKFPELLMRQIRDLLSNSEARLAVAESVTAGYLQLVCSQMENASAIFSGGITTYTIDEKIRILRVDPVEAKESNCVSSIVTEQMALEVSELFHTDWGIATTGYATGVPESNGELFAFFSIVYRTEVLRTETIRLPSATEATEAQFIYTVKALEAFERILKR